MSEAVLTFDTENALIVPEIFGPPPSSPETILGVGLTDRRDSVNAASA
jgi:hypothetical protein